MDKDFVAKGIAEGVNRVAFLYGESVINQKNNCCENNNKMTLTKEQMQKQIEAVRGLIDTSLTLQCMHTHGTMRGVSVLDDNGLMEVLNNQVLALRTLTETLKPYLGDDKLEV
jgi:hypothetical protein